GPGGGALARDPGLRDLPGDPGDPVAGVAVGQQPAGDDDPADDVVVVPSRRSLATPKPRLQGSLGLKRSLWGWPWATGKVSRSLEQARRTLVQGRRTGVQAGGEEPGPSPGVAVLSAAAQMVVLPIDDEPQAPSSGLADGDQELAVTPVGVA